MSLKEIKAIEEKLSHLALNGDKEAAIQYADLQRFRKDWESRKSAENWNDFVYAAQGAHAWLGIWHRNSN